MSWLKRLLSELAAAPIGGYVSNGPAYAEPTALAALALLGHGYSKPARTAANWLMRMQADDGSVGICPDHPTPRWPTALALLAWTARAGTTHHERTSEPLEMHIQAAVRWILSAKGQSISGGVGIFGHNAQLAAWPWVDGTHSWIEPTAMHVLALKAAGQSVHSRTREGVAMLLDRQLPSGGCNYGNTFVLGQRLRPHIQPTGLAVLALTGEAEAASRLARSINFLEGSVSRETPTASLCWALMALTAHDCRPDGSEQWLEAAWRRIRKSGIGTYQAALLALAAMNRHLPFCVR